jgi:hypothetical protein
MIPKPKFEIGQLVSIRFKGELEGVEVQVTRKLFVSQITWGTVTGHYSTPLLLYRLCERMEETARNGISSSSTGHGKEWKDITEVHLEAVEPVLEELVKAEAEAGQGTSQ